MLEKVIHTRPQPTEEVQWVSKDRHRSNGVECLLVALAPVLGTKEGEEVGDSGLLNGMCLECVESERRTTDVFQQRPKESLDGIGTDNTNTAESEQRVDVTVGM